MTWENFLLWMLIAYLVYYTINIIYDLFLSANKQGGSDDGELYELRHQEKVEIVDVQELLNSQEKKKNNNETVKRQEQLNEVEEELEHEERYVPTESTGGITVKSLFSIYSGKASIDTDSILWD